MPWKLTAKQGAIYRTTSRYLVLVAGRRFGKTVVALAWLISEVVNRGRGSLGYYVAPFRVMAKAIAWDMLLVATRELRTAKNESELTVTLVGNRKIALKGADDPETLEGVGLVAVVLDEFGRMKLDAWQKSLRPALSDKRGRALICGKPRGHNHLKDFYERGQDPKQPEWSSWLYRTIDGGFVPSEDIAEAKGTLPAKVYRQEYEATFESLAGRVYEDFQRRTHVVAHDVLERRFKQGSRWQFRRIIIAVDWGFTDPGCALVMGITGMGDIAVLHEEYHRGKLVDASGWLGIFERLVRDYGAELLVADPSCPGYIAAARDHFSDWPDVAVRGAQNTIAEGIRRLSIALLLKPPNQRPGLVMSDHCVNLIRELEGYVFREARGVATEEPLGGSDHACDSARYGCMELTRSTA